MGKVIIILTLRQGDIFHLVTSPGCQAETLHTGIRFDSGDNSPDIFGYSPTSPQADTSPKGDSAHPRPLRVTNHQHLLTIDSQASVSAGHSLCACSEENRYCLCDERHGFKEVSMCQAGAYSGPAHTHSFVPREQSLLFVAQYPHTSSTGTLLSCHSTPRTLGSRWQ